MTEAGNLNAVRTVNTYSSWKHGICEENEARHKLSEKYALLNQKEGEGGMSHTRER